jgi:hypothetical protein
MTPFVVSIYKAKAGHPRPVTYRIALFIVIGATYELGIGDDALPAFFRF